MSGTPSDNTAEVLRLGLVEGVGVRAIARQLGMARKTVRQILGRSLPRSKPVVAPRDSLLDPYDKAIHSILESVPDIRAPAMLERLRPLGYMGGVTILRARLHRLRKRAPREAFLTLHFQPGSAMQVDWADFGFALPGIPRRVSAFVAALCYSRYLYVEFTLSQSFGSLVRCMERCLRFYGGTTEIDIFDNMKTVVRSHTPAATVFNPGFLEYARARGFAVRACNVGRGNEKGRVERPIGFLRTRFWPGRRFRDLLDLNVQATRWRDDFANKRIHEVTGRVPALVYQHDEKPKLKPLDGPNLWPDEHEWRDTIGGYLDVTARLGERVLAAVAEALDLQAPFLGVALDGYLVMKLIGYHPQPSLVAARPGVAPHVDFSWLTLTLQSDAGLEVRGPDGHWTLIEPRPTSLWVHAGELLQFASCGRYTAVPHRVINQSIDRTRVSIPLFLNPPLTGIVPVFFAETRPPTDASANREHVHRVLRPDTRPVPFHFGQAEWQRKRLGRWCAVCTAG